MKPQYATNPDGEPVVLITPVIPDPTPFTLDQLKQEMTGIQTNIGMADSSTADLLNQVQAWADKKTAWVARLANLQIALDNFPIDVQPAPAPVQLA